VTTYFCRHCETFQDEPLQCPGCLRQVQNLVKALDNDSLRALSVTARTRDRGLTCDEMRLVLAERMRRGRP
jgi:hypothetical protein